MARSRMAARSGNLRLPIVAGKLKGRGLGLRFLFVIGPPLSGKAVYGLLTLARDPEAAGRLGSLIRRKTI